MGTGLTAKGLYEDYYKLNQDYFGSDMTVDREIGYEWERIPHFYTPFYVYQYATGFSAAVAISSRILRGEEDALEGYRRFLKGGCSKDPISLLKLCGVDMSGGEPVEEALRVFGELLDEFEKAVQLDQEPEGLHHKAHDLPGRLLPQGNRSHRHMVRNVVRAVRKQRAAVFFVGSHMIL